MAKPSTGRLEIQDGHHRTEAAKKAGLEKFQYKFGSSDEKTISGSLHHSCGANKTLGEDGWEFVSLTRLPEDIIGYLIRSLKLSFFGKLPWYRQLHQ